MRTFIRDLIWKIFTSNLTPRPKLVGVHFSESEMCGVIGVRTPRLGAPEDGCQTESVPEFLHAARPQTSSPSTKVCVECGQRVSPTAGAVKNFWAAVSATKSTGTSRPGNNRSHTSNPAPFNAARTATTSEVYHKSIPSNRCLVPICRRSLIQQALLPVGE